MTTSVPRTEQEIRQRLDQLKHEMYLAKREGQLLRLELRIDLMRERAREAIASGKITEQDVRDVHDKRIAFGNRLRELKAAGDQSTKESRAHVTEAWNELMAALQAAREKAGVAKKAAV